jgi:TonB family protein
MLQWFIADPGPLIEALALALLHFLWQGLVIAALLGFALQQLRESSANLRYSLALGALILLVAAVPLTTWVLLDTAAAATASPAGPAMSSTPALLPDATSTPRSWDGLLHWVVLAWLAGVGLASMRLQIGWRGVQALRRQARIPGDVQLEQALRRMAGLLGTGGRVQIAVSPAVAGPLLIGWLKPLILLPPGLVASLARDQIEMVLAHELAHFRRNDHWVNLFQLVCETLLFYHPAVRWVSRRIRIERENACDDLAVAATGRRLDYVEMLAAVEQQRPVALALGVHDGQMVHRIRRLVEGRDLQTASGGATTGLVLLLFLAASVGAPMTALRDVPETRLPARTVSEAARGAADAMPPNDLLAVDLSGPPPQRTDTAAASPRTRPDQREATPPGQDQPPQREVSAAPGPNPSTVQAAAETGSMRTSKAATSARIDEPPRPPVVAPSAAEVPPSGFDRSLRMQPEITIPEQLLVRHVPAPAALALAERPDLSRSPGQPPQGGRLLQQTLPDYPRSALRRAIGGQVELELTVGSDGRVAEIEVLHEVPQQAGFAAAATRAARTWKFEPFQRDGQSIRHQTRVEFEFDPAEGCRRLTGTRIPRC